MPDESQSSEPRGVRKRLWLAVAGGLLVVVAVWFAFFAGDDIPSSVTEAPLTSTSSVTSSSGSAPSSSTSPTTADSQTTSTSIDPTTTSTDQTDQATVTSLAETTTTTLTASSDPDAGRDENSPVPMGEAIVLGSWRIGVSDALLDATDFILEYVDFNEPPDEGSQYVVVELSGVFLGDPFGQPVFDWALVGPDFEHIPAGLECGVVPESIYDVGDVPTGTQFTANVCFEVPSDQVDEDLMLTLGVPDAEGRQRYFALR